MLKSYFAVMAGGAVGTAGRMFLSSMLANRYGEIFPTGTLVVNITGCFCIGLFAGLTGPEGVFFVSPLVRQFVMIGVLGGYTTFSSFSLQTLNLLDDGEWLHGGLNVFLTMFLCLAAVWLGSILASVINQRR